MALLFCQAAFCLTRLFFFQLYLIVKSPSAAILSFENFVRVVERIFVVLEILSSRSEVADKAAFFSLVVGMLAAHFIHRYAVYFNSSAVDCQLRFFFEKRVVSASALVVQKVVRVDSFYGLAKTEMQTMSRLQQ